MLNNSNGLKVAFDCDVNVNVNVWLQLQLQLQFSFAKVVATKERSRRKKARRVKTHGFGLWALGFGGPSTKVLISWHSFALFKY
jgi:hypothetical protein